MSQSRARQTRRRQERKAKADAKRRQPRCPVCANEMTAGDRVAAPDGRFVHPGCVERLRQARAIALEQRAKASGLWLPSDG